MEPVNSFLKNTRQEVSFLIEEEESKLIPFCPIYTSSISAQVTVRPDVGQNRRVSFLCRYPI